MQTPDEQTPIESWLAALATPAELAANALLQGIYAVSRPAQAEIIFEAGCAFACRHCIYPPTYNEYNGDFPADQWESALTGVHQELGVQTFVYSGRAVVPAGVEVLQRLRREIPEAKIGLIDNGISIVPHLDALESAALDWVDISLDGMPEDHDRQRRRPGSFKAAQEGAFEVRRRQLAPRLSVLTCLTTLNRASVGPMIAWLNHQGLKNFFVVPAVVVPGVRPDPSLSVSASSLRSFVDELEDLLRGLEDAYVEVGLFEADRMAAICAATPDESFLPVGDHLCWHRERQGNELAIRYFPGALVGVRELIINTTGAVILPKGMALGQLPPEMVIGNVGDQCPGDIWRRLPHSPGFASYTAELRNEREFFTAKYPERNKSDGVLELRLRGTWKALAGIGK